MSRYQSLFARLRAKKEGAFIPFVVLGDPTFEISLEIIQTLVDAGADALELGLPFSDPVADGPVIQRADMRALKSGMKFKKALELLGAVRAKNPSIPIGILTYANLVVHDDIDRFYGAIAGAGVDSLLIADIPTLEIKAFADIAKKHKVEQVMIVPPNVDEERLRRIAKESSGYIYVVTRSGVTGADEQLSLSSQDVFARLQDLGAAPGVYGFGISTPSQVREALLAGAAGAISGSAITAIIEKNLKDSKEMLKQVAAIVREMKAATEQ